MNILSARTIPKIVIVYPDAAMRKHIVKSFSYQKFEVVECESSKLLLKNLDMKDFDCLILNLESTHLATEKLIGEIRRQNSQLRIVTIGNKKNIAQAVMSIQAGADDYLGKPVSSGEIKIAVNQLLGG